MTWQDVERKIRREISIGEKIPKARGGARPVTRIFGNRIYMDVGKSDVHEKFTTFDMLKLAYETIESGKTFRSSDFSKRFPKEYKTGPCVFSMTGGILVKLNIAEYDGNGYVKK